MESPPRSLGETVRQHRLRRGLSQEDLAEITGISVRGIRNLEADRVAAPRPATLRLLADAFGVQVHDFEPGTPAKPAPAQLPRDVAGFTGRDAALRRLWTLVDAPGPQPIPLITGPAGVGKTTLAVHWAHLLADRFPDGRLYVNLHGFGPGDVVVAPGDVLADFLVALGVPRGAIPAAAPARAALYRGTLAGRRVLVVLDNARDAEQVRPLLPAAGGCLAIVTSRDRLAGLVASDEGVPVPLDVLSSADAEQLLARRLGADRLAGEPAAVSEIVARCDRLPLALAVVAARAAVDPEASLGDIAAELSGPDTALDVLAGGDAATDVRVVLSWSARSLTAPARQLFLAAGLHTGPDLDQYAAANLSGLSLDGMRQAAAELIRLHLMHRRPAQRYGMHDLLRAYARESAEAALPEVERRAAIGRLHDFYRHTVYQLRDVLIPRGILSEPAEPAVPMSFDGEPARQTWAAVERANLVATAVAAAHDGWSGYVREMTYCLWPYLYQSGYGEECLSLSTAALDAARAAGDVDAEATALNHAAGALATLGRYAETVEYGEASLRLYRIQGDDPIAEARLLSNLSEVYATLGRSRQAKANAEEATRLRREHAGSVTIASGLATLAILDLNLGLVDEALGHARESVARYDATDLPLIWERVEALDALGQVLLRLGRLDEAREQLARAHEISRSAAHGDHLHSQTLTLLATVCRRQGDPGAAEGLAQEGLALANGTGDPELISAALAELAQLRREQDRAADAVREARRALSVAAEAGHRRAEMIAHRVLGETLIAGGDPAAGDRHLDAALGIALEVEDPYEQELARGQRNRQNG